MPPFFANFDTPYCGVAYAKLVTNFPRAAGGVKNLANLFFGKSRLPVCRSARRPALGFHVGHVVAMGAEKQMVRVDARRNVTAVADKHSKGNRAVGILPNKPRGNAEFSLPPYETIALWVASSSPQEAAIRPSTAVVSEFRFKRPVAWHALLSVFWHSLNRPPQTVIGQGRCRR